MICIGVLGAGLGAVLFLLTLVNGLILSPLPFPAPERLFGIGYERSGDIGIGTMNGSDYLLISQSLSGTTALGAYAETNIVIRDGNASKRYAGTLLSKDMPGLLGATPMLGRAFSAADNQPGAALTVMLGERAWRRDFDARPAAIGATLQVNGEPATVIGIYPASFSFPNDSQVWIPLRASQDFTGEISVVAQMATAQGLAPLRAALASMGQALGPRLDGQRASRKLIAKPLTYAFINETTRSYVWIMFAASAMVLLLACINCANLQLAQLLQRGRDLAIYSALGASRAYLLRQQLIECLLLSVAASLVAVAVAHFCSVWLLSLFEAYDQSPPYFVHLGVDGKVLGLALVCALLTTLLAGALPAVRASRADPQEALREGGKGASGGSFARIAQLLVIFEIALTVILLVGAGTFIRGLDRVVAQDIGASVKPDDILTARVELSEGSDISRAEQAAFFEHLTARLRNEPAVIAATVSNAVPGAVLGSHEYIGIPGAAVPAKGYARGQLAVVDDHFASVYGIKLTAGRLLDGRDQDDTARVVVISRMLADLLWPGQDPLGQTLALNPQRETPQLRQVVGVVEDLQLEGPLEPRLPAMMLSMRQSDLHAAVVAIHVRGPASDFATAFERAVTAERPGAATFMLRTQSRAIASQRMSLVILTRIFSTVGLLALLLAASGLYGVLSFAVTQRTREIGIRRALGASNRHVLQTVGVRLLLQVGAGLACGLGLAVPWTMLLADSSIQTREMDLAVLAAVTLAVLSAALLSCFVPLRRVLAVDPMVAVRHE